MGWVRRAGGLGPSAAQQPGPLAYQPAAGPPHRLPLTLLRPCLAPPGDFPDVDRYRDILSAFDLSRFPKLDKAMIRQVGALR